MLDGAGEVLSNATGNIVNALRSLHDLFEFDGAVKDSIEFGNFTVIVRLDFLILHAFYCLLSVLLVIA